MTEVQTTRRSTAGDITKVEAKPTTPEFEVVAPIAITAHEGDARYREAIRQLDASESRNRELERELAATTEELTKVTEELRLLRAGKAAEPPKVPLTQVQRLNQERRRRRELMVMPSSRLIELAMKHDNRTRTDLTKMSRDLLITVIVDAERKLIP